MITEEEFTAAIEAADRAQRALAIAVVALGRIRNNGWSARLMQQQADESLREIDASLREMQAILEDV